MEDIYEKRKGEVDVPHRHNYYTVLIIKKAKGLHKIDFHNYELSEKQIYFVSPGQVHQVVEDEKSIGYVMTFSTDFLIQNSIPLSFISDLNLFQDYGQTPPLLAEDPVFQKIYDYSSEVYKLFKSNENNKLLSIGSFVKLILIQCSNICTIQNDSTPLDSTKGNLIRNFKIAVDEQYRKEHSTSYYAQFLNITPDHLNRSVKEKLGKTAKEYIQSRIITEAKRLLFFTDMTNKEIGYKLGFNEPSNFSAFFKKCTQLSPSKFKKLELTS